MSTYTLAQVQERIREQQAFGNVPDFSQAHFKKLAVERLDLSECVCTETTWKRCTLPLLLAQETDFHAATFCKVVAPQSRMRSADLAYSTWEESDLSSLSADGADLRFTLFAQANLQRASLLNTVGRGAILRNVCFRDVNCALGSWQEADFSGVDCRETTFRLTNLAHAKFTGANLTQAHLCHADLHGAFLDEVDLRYADLQFADLTGVHWSKEHDPLAQLRAATLAPIAEHFHAVCAQSTAEAVEALHSALVEGHTPDLFQVLQVPKPIIDRSQKDYSAQAQSPAHAVYRFAQGLLPDKEDGLLDPSFTDEPIRRILLSWCDQRLSEQ